VPEPLRPRLCLLRRPRLCLDGPDALSRAGRQRRGPPLPDLRRTLKAAAKLRVHPGMEDRRGSHFDTGARQRFPREAHPSPRVKRRLSERSRDWLRLVDPAPAWLGARHGRRRAADN
jgi:hypothetical protein